LRLLRRSKRAGLSLALWPALLGMGILVAACGSNGSSASSGTSGTSGSTASASGSFVVGFTPTLTGAYASIGAQELLFTKAVFNQVNASGGIDGHQVKLEVADAGETDPTATAATLQVIGDGASIVMGQLVSDQCAASVSTATRFRVPLLCVNADPSSLSPVNPYVFMAWAPEVTQATPMLQFMKKVVSKSSPRIGIVVDDDIGAQDYATAIAQQASQFGGKVVSQELASLTAANINPEISDLIAAKPDVVFTELLPSQDLPLVKQLRAAGSTVPVFSVAPYPGYSTLQSIADPGFYQFELAPMLEPTASAPAGPTQVMAGLRAAGVANTAAAMNQVYGSNFSLPALAVVQALKTCGYPCDGSALDSVLQKTTLNSPGFADGYGFSSSSHQGARTLMVYVWNSATNSAKLVASGLSVAALSSK
jgi:branched-chain amino acid transport system substrate-binding protein